MQALLKKLEAQIQKKAPQAHAALRPPAEAAALARLHAHFGGAAPAELVAWYGWHDGEVAGPGVGFDPSSVYFPLPLDEGLRVGAEVLGGGQGHPLLADGGGGWICWQAGALVRVGRGETGPFAESLESWISGVVAALSAQKPPKVRPPARGYTFEPVVPAPATLPALRALGQEAAQGAVYVMAQPVIGASDHSFRLFAKVAPNQWLALTSARGADVQAALPALLAEWQGFVLKAPSKNSGYLLTDEQLVYEVMPRPDAHLLRGSPGR